MNRRCQTADGLRSEGTQRLSHVYRINSANESLHVGKIARLNLKHVSSKILNIVTLFNNNGLFTQTLHLTKMT